MRVSPDRSRRAGRFTRLTAVSAAVTLAAAANPDGSYTRKVYVGPVNYKAADGSWTPIDTTLAKAADGRLHARANAVGVDFAASAADGAVASLRLDAGHSVQ